MGFSLDTLTTSVMTILLLLLLQLLPVLVLLEERGGREEPGGSGRVMAGVVAEEGKERVDEESTPERSGKG